MEILERHEQRDLRVAEAVARMQLQYAVITSVDRDDLEDGDAQEKAARGEGAGSPADLEAFQEQGRPDRREDDRAPGPAGDRPGGRGGRCVGTSP